MKKAAPIAVCAIFLVFVSFLCGFFYARVYLVGPVTVEHPDRAATVCPTSSQLPEPETDPAETFSVPPPAQPSFPIDINTAGVQELTALPGIGEVLSHRIVAYREVSGPFSAPEDLINVSGIGEKRLAQILPYITTGGAVK